MIVLDEQLLGYNLESRIGAWYPGAVRYITDLRRGSVIKDDNIAHLLHRQNHPIFVTINESDFWRKIEANHRYCIVCFVLPNSLAPEISNLLRALLSQSQFNTKAKRNGKVILVTPNHTIRYYSHGTSQIITLGTLGN